MKEITDACGAPQSNISGALAGLAQAGFVEKTKNGSGVAYTITDAGIEETKAPGFGEDRRATPRAQVDSPPLNMGVFTNGELHIEANGKKLMLTRPQAVELVDFVCSLPNKLFSTGAPERPTLSSLPSRIHRVADE